MTKVIFNAVFSIKMKADLNNLLFTWSEQMSPFARQFWLTEKNVALRAQNLSRLIIFLSIEF